MEIRIATNDDIEYMMSSRLEMLKEVNSLDPDNKITHVSVIFRGEVNVE
ncbi:MULTISPECIES: hypothetical protein [Butyrivibrio]|nr:MULTISPECIES: hypothetical protein [Butyrivibrio]SEQ07087.1 hypothetical protein SAMN02910382_01883 [Butyrivibrio sp. TB]